TPAAQSRNESRSLEELDPDPIRVLEVDFGSLGVLRRYGRLRSFSDQFAVGFPNVCDDERQMVHLLTLSIGRMEPAARGIPVQLEFLAGAGSHELHVLATVAHRPLVHDLHPDGLRVEGEGPVEVPNANARVVESILHGECNPGWRYVVATVIRRRWPLSSYDDRPAHHGMKRTVARIRPRLGERVPPHGAGQPVGSRRVSHSSD